MPAPKKRKKSFRKNSSLLNLKDFRVILALLLLFLLTVSYLIFLDSNVYIRSESYHVYIPAKISNEELGEILKEEEIISNKLSFVFAANLLDLVPPETDGLHELRKGWNNISLIQHLKNSRPKNFKILEIKPYRSRKTMIRDVCKQLGLDKEILSKKLQKVDSLYGFDEITPENVFSLFIPGRYRIPSGVEEGKLISILHDEFLHFWNKNRRALLNDIGLLPTEAIILASIVYSETKVEQEMSIISGVYLNRLKKEMRLEADPTLVYASGNPGTRRVYINNKKLLHPEYNTYRRKGLPPGPIHFPPPEVIDAVLHSEDHDFLYFCAKGDTTGCHLFAETFEDHKINAEKFRKNLDMKKIFK